MAALGSQPIASSYEQLLHVDRDQGGNTTTHVSVKDGDNGTTFGFTIATDALMMSSTNRLEFGDTGTYIHQSADGVLDLVSDTEIEINATTIDVNGALDLSGNAQLSGTVTVGADGSGTDVIFYSGTAGDNFTWDASEEKLTITGTNAATALDVADGNVTIADDLAVDGTSNLDNTDIDGTLVQDGGNVVFNEASADYDFRVESNGNANMLFVDGGANAVGIGTNSPDVRLGQQLDIATTSNYGGMSLSTWSPADAQHPIIELKKSGNATINSHTILADDEMIGAIVWRGSDGSAFQDSALIRADIDGTPGSSDMPGRLMFSTTADGASSVTERMRIDSAGNVGIAMTAGGSHKLDVTGSAGLSTGTAWTNTSDERIKTNVETIENGLDKINQLRPISFNYSEDYLEQHPEINASKKYNSFIAQEYADVFPDAVSICGDLEKVTVEGVKAADGIEAVEEEKEILVEDMLQFTPHDLNMYLVAAVQELSEKVAVLEAA